MEEIPGGVPTLDDAVLRAEHIRIEHQTWLSTDAFEALPSLGVLKTDPRVIDLVLAGCRTVGDKVVDPRFGECEITQRSIGDRFGILYTMKTPNGSLVSFEFFD